VSERVTVAPVIRPGRPKEASRLVELCWWVSPEERRQGLARALVVELAQRLRTRGARRITALVEREHGPAMAFWGSLRDIGCARDPRMMRFVL